MTWPLLGDTLGAIGEFRAEERWESDLNIKGIPLAAVLRIDNREARAKGQFCINLGEG